MHTDKYGLLINAAVSLAIAVVAIIVGTVVVKRQRTQRIRAASIAFMLYWLALAVLYFFVSVRTVLGYFGLEQLDYVFFFVDNVFGGLMVAPAIFLFIYFLTTRRNLALGISSVFIIVWAVWSIINISAGAGNYTLEFWYTEWEPSSELARSIAIFGLYVPAAIAILGMNFALIRAQTKLARYRILLTSISFLAALTTIIIDYLRPGPPWVRIIILVAALIGYFAYIPPRFILTALEAET
jgi:hypothetical protein